MKKSLLTFLLFCAVLSTGYSAPPPGGIYPFFDDFESYNGNAGSLSAPWYGGASSFKCYDSHGLFETKAMSFESSFSFPKDSIQTQEIGPLTSLSKLYFHYRLIESTLYPQFPYALSGDASFKVKMVQFPSNVTTVFSLDSIAQGSPTTNFNYVEIPLSAYAGQTMFIEFFFDMGSQTGQHFIDIDDVGVSDVVITGVSKTGTMKRWNYFFNGSELQLNDVEASQYRLYNTNGTLISEWSHNPGTEVKSLSNIASGLYVLSRYSGGTVESKKLVVH